MQPLRVFGTDVRGENRVAVARDLYDRHRLVDGLAVVVVSVISTTGFTGAPTSLTAAGGSTIATGFTTGTVNGGALIGPFTLTAGTFFVGCAYHYVSENMRTVLVVAANATPGPQATPPPSATPPPPGSIY
jgi:hypothetical protein